MAISDSLNKRLRARRDEEEDDFEDEMLSDEMEDIEEDAGSNSDEEEESSNSDAAEPEEDDKEEEESDNNSDISDTQSIQSANDREAIQSEFRQISFGALAKAQNSIGKKRKRGTEDKPEDETEEKKPSSTLEEIRERLRLARERKLGLNTTTTTNNNQTNNSSNNNGYNARPKPPPRTSKHAPAVQSSKIAVSRKRTIIEPTTTKSRDPRFDPTVVKSTASARHNNSSAENAYAFLDDYRASEIKQLKEQLAKTKDAAQKDELKRAITSASDRQRTLDNRKREREVLQEHKKKEKQLIKEGKKSQPYFLKKSELKREVLKKKYESMGSKERSKALERKRKKVASKEKKDLPWARRGMES